MVHIATRNNNAFQSQVGTSLTTTFRTAFEAASGKKPWESIIDFATHPSFCGLKLYPRQQTLLKLMYLETENMTAYDLDVIEEWRTNFARLKDRYGVQPDLWERVKYLKENGYTHFPHVQAVQGRRASKGVIGGIIGTERIAYMIALDNPQDHYGIMSESIYFMIIATNSLQAKRFLFADVRKTVANNKWLSKYVSISREQSLSLRTPADIRMIAKMQAKKIPIEYEIASIRVLPMSSMSTSGRGASAFMLGYDEMAHMITGTGGNRSSEEVYEAYQPSLDQFGSDAMTYIPSSPFSKIGRFYELYTSGSVLLREFSGDDSSLSAKDDEELKQDPEETFVQLTADPTMLIVQLPSWELYKDWERGKQLVNISFKRAVQYPPEGDRPENKAMARLRQRNPVKFKVERGAQFAEVLNAYLDSDKIEAMFSPFWAGSDRWPDGRILSQNKHGIAAFKYQGHADPGKCLTQDSYVFSTDGIMKITQVMAGDVLVSNLGVDRVGEWIESGEKEIYKLTTKSGHVIRGSIEHPVLTQRGWVRLGEIETTDKVKLSVGADVWSDYYVEVPKLRVQKRSNGTPCHPTKTVDERMGRLLGYIVSEGSIQSYMLTVTSNVDEPTTQECISLVRELFGIEPTWTRIKGKASVVGWNNTHMMSILEGIGLNLNVHSRDKEIPWSVLQSPKTVVIEFLKSYFSGDGTTTSPAARDRLVSVTTASEVLSKQVQIVLSNLGMLSHRKAYMQTVNEAGERREYYTITMRGEHLRKFVTEVGFLEGFEPKRSRSLELAGFKMDSLPGEFYVGVRSVVEDGVEQTYDLCMESGEHNFAANGLICHNSNANFAVAVAHLETSPIPDIVIRNGEEHKIYWPHVIVDHMDVWKPEDYKDHIVDYVEIGESLLELPQLFPTMTMFSYDQWNSAGFIANMKRRYSPRVVIKEETFTEQSVQKTFESFKSALNLGWVHSYRDDFYGSKEEREEGAGQSLLELECKFLSEKNGKVVKQEVGPVTTKDLFDCLSVITVRLLKDSLDRWYKEVLGRTPLIAGSEGGHPKSGPAGDHLDVGGTNPLRRNLSSLESYRYGGAGGDPARGRLDKAIGQPRGWGQRPQGFGLRGRLGSGR